MRSSYYICLVFSFTFLFTACSHSNINYNQKRIQKLYKEGYRIHLNGNKIKPDFYFLDKKNIAATNFNGKAKIINITQKNINSLFFDINDLTTQAKSETGQPKNIKIVIINGVLIDETDFQHIQIEAKALKEINYLSYDTLSKAISHARGGCLLISTKHN